MHCAGDDDELFCFAFVYMWRANSIDCPHVRVKQGGEEIERDSNAY
jgi:hypothetical protein